MKSETIVLGGGCFWCTEAIMKRVKGVIRVTSGYAGGTTKNPTYEEVGSGRTGHAEVVKVEFNANKIKLDKLLEIFFKTHDPTTLNRQGADWGSQYRSIILATSEDQEKKARDYKEKLDKSGKFRRPIVTEIKRLEKFYPAEERHQHYYEQYKQAPYCQVVIGPKLKKYGLTRSQIGDEK